MQFATLAVVLAAIGAVAVAQEEVPATSGGSEGGEEFTDAEPLGPSYAQLDANNFQVEVDSTDIVVVCFYHSKADPEDDLDTEFVLAAGRLDAIAGVSMAAVDCAYEKMLQKKYDVEDFPAVRLFRDGKVYHYRRALEADALVAFVEKLKQPPVRTLSTVTEAIDMTESDKPVIIGFFAPENTKEYEVFLNVAASFQSADDGAVDFAEVVDPKVVKEFEIVYTPMVFLFRPHEDATGFTGMFTEVELADWITISTTPTLRELTPETFLRVFEDNTPTLLAFVEGAGDPARGPLLTALTDVSVKYLHKINFAFTERTHFEGLAEKMGVPTHGNAVTILDFHKREHFILKEAQDGPVSKEGLANFADEFLANNLVRAEDGIMTAHEGEIPETVVIANPNNELMMDFYVPWCDFYINVGVPHSGLPRVSLLTSPPVLDVAPGVATEAASDRPTPDV